MTSQPQCRSHRRRLAQMPNVPSARRGMTGTRRCGRRPRREQVGRPPGTCTRTKWTRQGEGSASSAAGLIQSVLRVEGTWGSALSGSAVLGQRYFRQHPFRQHYSRAALFSGCATCPWGSGVIRLAGDPAFTIRSEAMRRRGPCARLDLTPLRHRQDARRS